MVQLHELSHAQSELILVQNFFDALFAEKSLPSSVQDVLWLNFRLFALSTMKKSALTFSRARAVSDKDLDLLSDTILGLMQEIRPHAVRLVDAWSIPDYLLDR